MCKPFSAADRRLPRSSHEIGGGVRRRSPCRGGHQRLLIASAACAAALAGCGPAATAGMPSGGSGKGIRVVAAENEYGNVAAQIGGRYVSVSSVESNPNTDPHTYEVSPGVAAEVSGARVLIQNGVGYDDYMTKIAGASPSSSRLVINVQHLLGLPDSTLNPHLWYSPATMPKVAGAMAADFARLQPAHAAYFTANVGKFDASLKPWLAAIAQFKAEYGGTPVATTEPVADYMLQAIGAVNLTPFSFQAAIMNGTDPSPQGVSAQDALFSDHKVKMFVHNQQVTDSLTEGFVTAAKRAGIPVVGVYETMPTPGYTYQSWMLAEVEALRKAVADRISTATL
jgi:zinc/manganese transport system substrate-binding protein